MLGASSAGLCEVGFDTEDGTDSDPACCEGAGGDTDAGKGLGWVRGVEEEVCCG